MFAILTYILGTGIAHYLGEQISGIVFWLGFTWLLLIQMAAYLLSGYYRPSNEPLIAGETNSARVRLRTVFLQLSAAFLTLVAALTVIMLRLRLVTPSSGVLLGFIFLLLMAYSIPPLRMANTGIGELIIAVLLADLIPGVAFLLQSDQFHRILSIVTFPLTMLAVAYLLALEFRTFASDLKYGRGTLLIRLTWPRAVLLHPVLIIASYGLFVISPFFGFPWSVLWPVFLTIPLAGYQIILLRNIASGGKPIWPLLSVNGIAIFGLSVYLLTLSFWLH